MSKAERARRLEKHIERAANEYKQELVTKVKQVISDCGYQPCEVYPTTEGIEIGYVTKKDELITAIVGIAGCFIVRYDQDGFPVSKLTRDERVQYFIGSERTAVEFKHLGDTLRDILDDERVRKEDEVEESEPQPPAKSDPK